MPGLFSVKTTIRDTWDTWDRGDVETFAFTYTNWLEGVYTCLGLLGQLGQGWMNFPNPDALRDELYRGEIQGQHG
jgi:hypothetical protein